MNFKLDSYYDAIYQKFFLYIKLKNTHATETASLPPSISYAIQSVAVLQDTNVLGDELNGEVINFYNQLELERTKDVTTEKIRKGISNSAITLAPGEEKPFCIALPIFYN